MSAILISGIDACLCVCDVHICLHHCDGSVVFLSLRATGYHRYSSRHHVCSCMCVKLIGTVSKPFCTSPHQNQWHIFGFVLSVHKIKSPFCRHTNCDTFARPWQRPLTFGSRIASVFLSAIFIRQYRVQKMMRRPTDRVCVVRACVCYTPKAMTSKCKQFHWNGETNIPLMRYIWKLFSKFIDESVYMQ